MAAHTRKIRRFVGFNGVKSFWLVGFALVAILQLIFVAIQASKPALVTTWMLAPLLAAWVWQIGGPKLLILALVCCWIGDVLGNPRQIGIGHIGLLLSVASFIVANVCLIALFVRRGALATLWRTVRGNQRWRAAIVVMYIFGAAAGLWLAWSRLGPILRPVAATYLFLLVVTATTALMFDVFTGIGAALFFGAEMLIALAVAGQVSATGTTHRLEVLTLYMLGILFIAVGVVSREFYSKLMARR